MIATTLALILLVAPPQEPPPADPNAQTDESGETPRRPLEFRVFTNMDEPIGGLWLLEIAEAPPRRIRIQEQVPGDKRSLIGLDAEAGGEILRLEKKREGLGYEGQLSGLFEACGLPTLPISEFVPLGDAIVMKFETRPTDAPCAPIDSGKAGRFRVVSQGGGPVRLRDRSELSSDTIRDTYSIGGDRPNAELSFSIPLGAVSVEGDAAVRFLQRMKAPLDGSVWFEVEAIVSGEAAVDPPRGYLRSDSLAFTGSLTLKRIK